MIYYNFQRLSQNKYKRKGEKPNKENSLGGHVMCSVSRDEEATLSDFIVEGGKIDFAIVGEVKRAELRLGSILFRLQIPGQFALCFRSLCRRQLMRKCCSEFKISRK